MSGALNPTGTTAASGGAVGFSALLQHASFRFIPFKVLAESTTTGRKIAIHDYPFQDGIQAEDLGGRARLYRFTGYLVGPAGPVLEKLLLNAAESPGPGMLIHPMIGARNVVCLSCTTGARFDRQRVIEVHWEFLESSASNGLLTAIATAASVFATVASGIGSSRTSFNAVAVPAAAAAPEAKVQAGVVSSAFTAQVVTRTADGTGALRSVAGLPGNNGRYAAGRLAEPQAATTTAQALANATAARAQVVSRAATVNTTAANLSSASDYVGDLDNLMTAVRTSLIDPADQIRVLVPLTTFSYVAPDGTSTIGAAMAAMTEAVAGAARRAAALALASASAAYQPTSHEDALEIMAAVAGALDTEITAAGDVGDDATYLALRDVRGAVVADLMARGANLAGIKTIDLRATMPALWVAYRLYGDADRTTELVARVNPPHPAFMPASFEALST